MRELIFISSPYSNSDPKIRKSNYKLVSELTIKLLKEGYNVISPIAYGHPLSKIGDLPTDWNFWDEICLTFLEKSSKMIVYKLPGWENSRGVKMEIEFAEKHNISIEYVPFDDEIKTDSKDINSKNIDISDRIKNCDRWLVRRRDDANENTFTIDIINDKCVKKTENNNTINVNIYDFNELIFIKPIN